LKWNFLKKKNPITGSYSAPSIKYWNDSIYKYNKNIQLYPVKTKVVWKLFSTYINSFFFIKDKMYYKIIQRYHGNNSVSKPLVKHSNNKTIIIIFIYNLRKKAFTSLLFLDKFIRFKGKKTYRRWQKIKLLRATARSIKFNMKRNLKNSIYNWILKKYYLRRHYKYYRYKRFFFKYVKYLGNWNEKMYILLLKKIYTNLIFKKRFMYKKRKSIIKSLERKTFRFKMLRILNWKLHFAKNYFLMGFIFNKIETFKNTSRKRHYKWFKGISLEWRHVMVNHRKILKALKEKKYIIKNNVYNMFKVVKLKKIKISFLKRCRTQHLLLDSNNYNYIIESYHYTNATFKEYLAHIYSYRDILDIFNDKHAKFLGKIITIKKKINKIKLLYNIQKWGKIKIKTKNILINILIDEIKTKCGKILPLWYLNYKFQTKTLLNLHYILSKIYQNDIEIKLINLNYIFLDSYILTKAIAKRMRIMRINSKKYKHRAPKKVFVAGYSYAASAQEYISIKYINNYRRKIFHKNPFFIKNRLKKNQTIVNTGFQIKNILYNNKFINKYILYLLDQKKICGVHMIASGRLTRRYTAARAIVWKIKRGNLRNIASSNLGIKKKWMRGNAIPNVQRTTMAKSNRIGSYGIRTWISSH